MTEKEDIMKRFLALVGLMMIGVAPLAGLVTCHSVFKVLILKALTCG